MGQLPQDLELKSTPSGLLHDWKSIPTFEILNHSISDPTILTWTPTLPTPVHQRAEPLLSFLLKTRAQLFAIGRIVLWF